MEKNIKVCAIADLHGKVNIPVLEEDIDILLIAGDIVALEAQSSMDDSKEWFKNEFMEFLKGLPESIQKIFIVGGNHDFFIERHPKEFRSIVEADSRVKFLDHELVECTIKDRTIRIFGSPYCKKFGRWAFTLKDYFLRELFSAIPEDLDILLTHDAPFGFTDICTQDTPWNTHDHLGNVPLLEIVARTQPKWNIHGHLHSSSHIAEKIGETAVVNVSLLDEHYEMVYKPFYFKL